MDFSRQKCKYNHQKAQRPEDVPGYIDCETPYEMVMYRRNTDDDTDTIVVAKGCMIHPYRERLCIEGYYMYRRFFFLHAKWYNDMSNWLPL